MPESIMQIKKPLERPTYPLDSITIFRVKKISLGRLPVMSTVFRMNPVGTEPRK